MEVVEVTVEVVQYSSILGDFIVVVLMLLAIDMVGIVIALVMRFICAQQKKSFSTVVR